MPDEVTKRIGFVLKLVQLGQAPPEIKYLGNRLAGVREVRVTGADGNGFFRFAYAHVDGKIVGLHCFKKQTNKTAAGDIEKIQVRLAEYNKMMGNSRK